jgi:hypothetical protein
MQTRAQARRAPADLSKLVAVCTIMAQQGARKIPDPRSPKSFVWVLAYPEVTRMLPTCRAIYGDQGLLALLATSGYGQRHRTLLQHAASVGDRPRLQLLLGHILRGKKPYECIVDIASWDTPLGLAVEGGFAWCVEDLLAAGAVPARALSRLWPDFSETRREGDELAVEVAGLRAEAREALARMLLARVDADERADFTPQDGLELRCTCTAPAMTQRRCASCWTRRRRRTLTTSR